MNIKKSGRAAASLLAIIMIGGVFSGCAQQIEIEGTESEVYVYEEEYIGADFAAVVLDGTPAVASTLMPVASATTVYKNSKAEIDASNTADGYIMVRYLASTDKKIKVIVSGPSGNKYTYNLNNKGTYETLPLSDGNGEYSVGVYENVEGTKYSTSYSTTFTVKLTDEFAPYLRPNQYVNYKSDSKVVSKAVELTSGKSAELEKIKAVYEYVVNNFTYDKELAQTVQSGYIPDVDSVLAKQKGICFDYAAVMTAMLRSQEIPCKLVVGYAGTAYHAWINAYSEESGWMDSVIYFDGKEWKLMDPTFASSSNSSDSVMQYIGDGSNYSTKYLY